jgi:translation elongation factor EF-4
MGKTSAQKFGENMKKIRLEKGMSQGDICRELGLDIAILIVSAEDGVKAQTLEAWKTIGTRKLPYVVAINKIDKPGADVQKTKNSLVENGIYIEGMGGDVPCVEISAKKRNQYSPSS